MISSIEQELSAAGVRQSSHRPDSDVSPGHWSYASYRNEHKSNRSGTSNQHRNPEAEPFFSWSHSLTGLQGHPVQRWPSGFADTIVGPIRLFF